MTEQEVARQMKLVDKTRRLAAERIRRHKAACKAIDDIVDSLRGG